jgi:gas vesicle protein
MGNHGSNFGRIFSGLVIGVLFGAVGALLLAPQSGKKTRGMIRDEGLEIKDHVEHTAADVRHSAKQVVRDARHGLKDLQHRGQELLMETKDQIQEAVPSALNTVTGR